MAHTRSSGDFEAATPCAPSASDGVFPLMRSEHALSVIARAFPGAIEDAATRSPAR